MFKQDLGPSPAGLGPPSPHTNTSIDFDPWITPNFTHDEREFIKSQLPRWNNSSLTKATDGTEFSTLMLLAY